MKSLKKSIMLLGLGIGLAASVGAKEPGDGPNCFNLYQMCQDGHQVSCNRYDRYCL